MQRVNESELMEILQKGIEISPSEKIVFFAGHFPLRYPLDSDVAVESFAEWGSFSEHTLELGLDLAVYARTLGREVEFILIADDHTYERSSGVRHNVASRMRRDLYRKRSGDDAMLPPFFKEQFQRRGFTQHDVVRHDHEKSGRRDCLYFSEKVLRGKENGVVNPCAREYVEIFGNPKYFNADTSHLVAFVPQRCRGGICEVALDQELEINNTHVFMDSSVQTIDGIYASPRGVMHRLDIGRV